VKRAILRGVAFALSAAIFGCGGNSLGPPVTPPVRVLGSSAAGSTDGPPGVATFSNPANLTVAENGTIYVADFDNDAVRAISPTGTVSTLTKQPLFQRPFGITTSPDGKLYVSTDNNDSGDHSTTTGTVWQINRTTGVPTVIARNLGRPRGLVVLADGRIVCSDLTQSTVYLLDPTTGATTPLAGQTGVPGFAEGTGAAAQFSRPYGAALLPDGTILVADQTNNRIRQITLGGKVTTFAGTGAMGAENGTTSGATFNMPEALAVAPDGTVYVADHDNHLIRRITRGQVTTEAGDGKAGYVDAPGTSAEFYGLEGIALGSQGRILWIADGNNGDGSDHNHVRWLSVP
jgi:sugar lactone lactonase YvrE